MSFHVLSAAVFTSTVIGGTLATYTYDHHAPLGWRLTVGTCTGLAALGLIGFVLAMQFGLTGPCVAAAGVALGVPAGLLARRRYREMIAADAAASVRRTGSALAGPGRAAVLAAAVSIATAVLVWRVGDRVMFVRDDGIYTGASHNLGDLPFHLTITHRFVDGQNYPPEHPSFAGVGFTYPFLTDFIGGQFVVAGTPVREVIAWSTALLCLSLVVVLHRWTLDLTGSRTAARLAPPLALFSGGLGWWRFLRDAWEQGGPWHLLARLPQDYTITYDGEYRWGNLVTTLLVTQRGLLLGLPLAVIVFHLWWKAFVAGEEETGEEHASLRQARMIAAGLIAGMLPLIHAHSYVVVLGMGACLTVLAADRRSWLPFFSWALALGLPQILWITRASGIQGRSFVAWSAGWDHGTRNIILFWLDNTGLLIPLVIVALFARLDGFQRRTELRRFYLPFVLCFIGPNLLRLAPWIWDNIKVLVYWFIASVPLVALVLARMWERGRRRAVLAAALFAVLTFAGALDVWRVASGAFRSRIFTSADVEFAQLVAARTEPAALILHAPMPNHAIALSGRRSLMGYPGHVWSHGLDPGPREADIRRMFAGETDAERLLAQYRIDYVVIGPWELLRQGANREFYERYPLVVRTGEYRLYRVTGALPR